jgi:predicted GNAT family N-acyltransferase
VEIEVKIAESEKEFQMCLTIRRQVFIIGQNISEKLELDDDTISATSFLAMVSNEPIGTARFRYTEFGVKLERFAVLKTSRNLGVGKALVLFILNQLKNEKTIYLNAQESVISFYSKLGFEKVGDIFIEAEIPHQKMIYKKIV